MHQLSIYRKVLVSKTVIRKASNIEPCKFIWSFTEDFFCTAYPDNLFSSSALSVQLCLARFSITVPISLSFILYDVDDRGGIFIVVSNVLPFLSPIPAWRVRTTYKVLVCLFGFFIFTLASFQSPLLVKGLQIYTYAWH